MSKLMLNFFSCFLPQNIILLSYLLSYLIEYSVCDDLGAHGNLINSQFDDNSNQVNNLVIIRLYQAFDSEQDYQYRGLLTIQNNVPIIKQDPLTDAQMKMLMESAQKGDNYYLKAEAYQTLVFEHEKPYQTAHTFVPSCALLESQLKDQLWISLDVNSRFVNSVANVVNVHCSALSSTEESFDKTFNTTVLYSKTVISQGPETKTYLARLEQQKLEKLRGNKQDNRSFLAKYWYYIVPVMFLMLLSSSMNPEAGAR